MELKEYYRQIFPKLNNVNLILETDIRMILRKDKINLISSELLSGHPLRRDFGADRFEIADRLHRLFPDASIIVGFRKKDSWVRSLYSLYVKNGGILDFDNFYNSVFDKNSLEFEEYLDYLHSLFKSIYVYNFEDLKKNSEKFVKKMCDFIGVEVPIFNNRPRNVGWNEMDTIAGFYKDVFGPLVRKSGAKYFIVILLTKPRADEERIILSPPLFLRAWI